MQLLLLAALASANLAVTARGELEWSTHYAKAKESAAAAQKPLLVVLEDPTKKDRCFNDESLASHEEQFDLLKHFQLCRVDVTSPYGKRVADALGVTELPYTAITDKTAKFITFRSAGSMSPAHWAKTLNERKSGERVMMPAAGWQLGRADDGRMAAGTGSADLSQLRARWLLSLIVGGDLSSPVPAHRGFFCAHRLPVDCAVPAARAITPVDSGL